MVNVVVDGDDIEAGNKNNMKRKNKENVDEGRIHILPHKKHVPYTYGTCFLCGRLWVLPA